MFYVYDKVYRSLTYFVSQIVPSGVIVTDGESYGVRLEDPSGKPPSVAVTIEQAQDQAIELGSPAIQFSATITISAASRLQRDALKSIIHSGLAYNQISVYSNFVDFIPSGAAEQYAEVSDYFIIKDMPNFNTNREKFFWTSVIFADITILGI